jgi:hypothetical protein
MAAEDPLLPRRRIAAVNCAPAMGRPFPSIQSLFFSWGSGSTRELPLHRNAGLEIVYFSRGRLRWWIEDRVYEPGPLPRLLHLSLELHGSVDEFEPGHRLDFVVLTILGGRSPRDLALPPSFGDLCEKAATRQGVDWRIDRAMVGVVLATSTPSFCDGLGRHGIVFWCP